MTWSFRKRKIFGGTTLNFSKTGVSLTAGKRGLLSFNFGKNGIYMNQCIPGTGIYNRTKLNHSPSKQIQSDRYKSKTEIREEFFEQYPSVQKKEFEMVGAILTAHQSSTKNITEFTATHRGEEYFIQIRTDDKNIDRDIVQNIIIEMDQHNCKYGIIYTSSEYYTVDAFELGELYNIEMLSIFPPGFPEIGNSELKPFKKNLLEIIWDKFFGEK